MGKKFPLGVIHGRFQVLHNDHLKYLLAGKECCEHLVVGITNPDPTLTRPDAADPHRASPFANPLTYYERYVMVREALDEAGLDCREFSITPLPINFPDLYRYYAPVDAVYLLTVYDDWGRRKLAAFKAQGLATHVIWERPPEEKGIRASHVRGRILHGEQVSHLVPPAVERLVYEWGLAARLRALVAEN